MTYIYALIDPRDGGVRYVGKTINPRARLASHNCMSSDRNVYLWRWKAKLKRLGMRIQMMILDSVPDALNWRRYERAWIAALRYRGLANRYSGGDGPSSEDFTPERRARLSAALLGKKFTPEHSMAIGDALRGKPKTAAHKAAMAANHWSKRGGKPWNAGKKLDHEMYTRPSYRRTRSEIAKRLRPPGSVVFQSADTAEKG